MMGLDTPETCRGWRNILRISFASSSFFFARLYRKAQSTKHKKRIIPVSLHTLYLIQERRILSNNCHNSYKHTLLVKYTPSLAFAKWYPNSIRTERVLDVRHISVAFGCPLRLHSPVYSHTLKLKHRQLGLSEIVPAGVKSVCAIWWGKNIRSYIQYFTHLVLFSLCAFLRIVFVLRVLLSSFV